MTKRCTKCGQEKEPSEFAKYCRSKDGLQFQCKECYRAYYQAHKDHVKEKVNSYRMAHLDEVREKKRVYWKSNRDELVEKKRFYHKYHRDEHLEKLRVYRESHPGEIKEWKRLHYEANKDKVLEKQHLYYETHRAEHRKQARLYCKLHPERHRSWLARRRARKAGAVGADYTTAAMIQARHDFWGNRCYICGDPVEHTDHVKPLAKGGAHLPCNMRPICKSCNSRKQDKWPYAPAMRLERLP